jgi:hypothetical protein
MILMKQLVLQDDLEIASGPLNPGEFIDSKIQASILACEKQASGESKQ